MPGSYQGNLKDGCYTWMKPLTLNQITECTFKISADSFNGNWLCISGQANPDSAGNFPSHIGTIEINTVYEFTTCDQFMETKCEPFASSVVDQAYQVLSSLPTTMSNSEHERWISKVLRALVGVGAAGLTFATGGLAAPAIAAGLSAATASKLLF